ncbi:Diaminopimelate epimerase-like protein [Annulohypoxylon maeteangense]|uniref:Diaminopimelate epimerase-like protein n=1 Tax=Annulohypoxylon maeteangense TaxID=1927788 RepID=UPI002008B1FB|nr:Diaminopimelate epimerase-like protein [Annulohypoxylon maeteangense]KAI0880134.1 Diaminopimelate epimerase-like protein [Annulohypoxylon maeteangense]
MALNFTTFDVFTTTPFQGNPLAIVQVPIGTYLSQDQKQLIAREFNLSETVFLHEQTPEDVRSWVARVDIFTPLAEVPFAGHPTIGTSNFLLHHLCLGSAKRLSMKAGLITFKEQGSGAEVAVAHDVHIHREPFIGTPYAHHPVVSIVNGMTFILAQLPDLETLAQQTANLVGTSNTYTAKSSLDENWRHGIVVSYFFVDLGITPSTPWTRRLRTRSLGSREDPGTGSAASGLCAYLSLKEGEEGPLTKRYEIIQGVEIGRKNEIKVQVTLNQDRKSVEEILLSGDAVKVLEGQVPIPVASARVRLE